MLFTLEAVYAKHGDALILHYGPRGDPKWLLIDGGPSGVYRGYLRPRLDELRDDYEYRNPPTLPIELVLVSHVDDDHINGVIDLFEEQLDANSDQRPLPYDIKRFWHNSFDDVIGNDDPALLRALAELQVDCADDERVRSQSAVIASVGQGRTLQKDADELGIRGPNVPFGGLVLAHGPDDEPIDLGHGMTFRVLGPSAERVEAYQDRWDQELPKILRQEKSAAEVASMSDWSPFNLASIVVLAELGERGDKRSMLLTGDARGDDVLEGIERANLVAAGQRFHVDLLKLPHHGSDNNVDEDFFRRVTADHYVVSGDGRHHNPDPATLDMIAAARGDEPYTIHFTFDRRAHLDTTSETSRANLVTVDEWISRRPPNCSVVYRAGTDAKSIHVDLGEPLDRDGP